MKQIMKRMALAICLTACFLFLAACGKTDGEALTVEPDTAKRIEDAAQSVITSLSGQSDEDLELMKEEFETALEEDVMSPSQIRLCESLIKSIDNWKAAKQDTGIVKSFDKTEDWTISRTQDGGYKAEFAAECEQRRMNITMVFNERLSYYEAIEFQPVYSTGENMQSAGMNTLIGMGTVFIVLIFISLLISCFVFINKAEAKYKAGGQAKADVSAAPAVLDAPVQQENLVDDLELVAVITAAIAASENTSADGLVVRSIRRASGSRWKRG